MCAQINKQQFIELEKSFWDAILHEDHHTAAQLTAESSIVAGAQGVIALDPPTLEAMLQNPPFAMQSYEFDERQTHVLPLTDDVVIISYSVRIRQRIKATGEDVEFNAHDSSVWVKKDDKWLCALHTESLAGDPNRPPGG